ncbi:MAG: glycoside hydrolase family 127 protein [Saprospiraceae bacterium]|nr:glycoside hydrolase family 127 protein [Saprospiraceae bacterium]
MKLKQIQFAIYSLIASMICVSASAQTEQYQDYPITPVPFSKVQIKDNFWAPKIRTNHDVTIPIAYEQSKKTGRIDNFKIAGGLMEGQFCTEYPFDDTDIYKIIEAASYSIQTFPDKKMENMMDSLISYIAVAQEDDGYLYTTRTIGKNVHEWAGEQRWELVHDLSHELYNLGHLFEAAVAHYSATGKRNLLDIAIKSANLICNEFGEGKIVNYPGHQEVEIGLVKLYRVTKDERYLKLAKFFLDVRGRANVGKPAKYSQSHIPVTQQKEAVGHAVRGAYMWTGMADIAAIMGDEAYMKAINNIWHDIVDKKYYINGGIGATGSGEAFGEAYELPNMSAYCETCAGVGNAIWNYRMFLMTGESKFIDVLERSMYNNIIDGVSLSGDRFFYPNPLASYGQHERSEWFGCACCPPNVARFLPSMPGYIYAQKDNDIYVNLYIASESTFNANDNLLTISQQSGFPWQGDVKINFKSIKPIDANIKLRIPGYAINRPVPSDLYTYLDANPDPIVIKLNGKKVDYQIDDKGYVNIAKKWTSRDVIEIAFPIVTEIVQSHAGVTENTGKIAVERGPILYCAEWADNPNGEILNLIVPENQDFKAVKSEKLGGIYTIEATAKRAKRNLKGEVEVSNSNPLTLIPYHLWNNRGPGEMSVWLATDLSSARPAPAPTIANKSKVTASVKTKAIRAVNDQMYPKNSNDHTIPYIHWWPKKATSEWMQFDFEQPQEISSVKVYWFDDGPHGGCRIPASWEVQYKEGEEWKPVQAASAYKVTKDDWDVIQFKSLKTSALRLVVNLPQEYATGIYEVIIE